MITWALPCFAGTWDVVEAHRSDPRFVAPTVEERLAWADLTAEVARLAPSGVEPPDLDARAAALGFEVVRASGTVALVDRPDELRGAGLFAVRLGHLDVELVLEAPHPFFDLDTGRIASAAFDEGGVRAVVVATANRDVAPGSDPAHAPDSWFQAATEGLVGGLSEPWFVQLHGFAAGTTDACAVVTEGGARLPPALLHLAADKLEAALGCPDIRTGDQVPELAARTNAQSLLLAERASFLHIEMARDRRALLAADAEARARLVAVLADLARGTPP